ncbi:uncharacterized protein LOC115919066 isoform X1 [Strongylocentrotus purpuratus]|uniref:Uncharacterized protein n=1 Tax=Strongylocentrotus purpuratus TaxID=7668 RepID=A0A7M7PR79_STRPU|nr:uncharacterized protein LOC115919066 isoform X1 [Strongylocentrotus purpuratus]
MASGGAAVLPNGESEKSPAANRPGLGRTRSASSIYTRPTPFKNRSALAENYETPRSGREGWWRKEIRETPMPGSYDFKPFLEDFETRPATYCFKGEGRKKDAAKQGKGAALLPGAYEAKDNMYFLERTRHTYTFKNTSRSKDLPIVKDKNVNVCPTAYKMENVLSCAVEKSPSKRKTHLHANTSTVNPRHYIRSHLASSHERQDLPHHIRKFLVPVHMRRHISHPCQLPSPKWVEIMVFSSPALSVFDHNGTSKRKHVELDLIILKREK